MKLPDLRAYVWDCGDPHCECSQAIIEAVYPHPVLAFAIRPETIWAGEFHTDGEPGARTELFRLHQAMTIGWPAAAQAIVWHL